jgi:hypothetical protein
MCLTPFRSAVVFCAGLEVRLQRGVLARSKWVLIVWTWRLEIPAFRFAPDRNQWRCLVSLNWFRSVRPQHQQPRGDQAFLELLIET